MSSFLFLDFGPRSPDTASQLPARPKTASHVPVSPDHDAISYQLNDPMLTVLTSPTSPPPRPRRAQSSTRSPKRLSVFGSRSRSNTATSYSSSFKSPTPSTTSGTDSHRSSQDNLAFLPEKQESRTKGLIQRGSRILRRQGSKFSISANLTLDEEDEMARYAETANSSRERVDSPSIFHRHHRSYHSETPRLLKTNISEPFNFQHVTHTNPGQLPPLETTHPHDLATEFSILRAAQKPRSDLKGIRAESIYYRDLPPEDGIAIMAPDSQSLFTRSPPASPTMPTAAGTFYAPCSPPASRSVENFSRPVSRMHKKSSPSSPFIIPPPRSSSMFAGASHTPEPICQNVDALLGPQLPSMDPTPDRTNTKQEPLRLPLPDLAAAFSYEVGHALTTEDNTAIPMRSPRSHSSELADVPEEDETCSRQKNTAPKSAPPSIASSAAELHRTTGRPEPIRPLRPSRSFLHVPESSDAPHSPTIPPPEMVLPQPPTSKPAKRSKTPVPEKERTMDESWEDDIDYCYEHAAESTSDFDWQRSSSERARTGQQLANLTIQTTAPADPPADAKKPSPFFFGLQPPSATASDRSPADLTPASTLSTQPSTASTGMMHSPFEPYVSPRRPVTPSRAIKKPDVIRVLTPPYGDHVSPDQYELLITHADPDAETQLAFYPHAEDSCTSARSSGSPLSKCNSQESMILSRAGSIARKHRSSTSTNSVPELVHSSNCSSGDPTDREGFPEPPRAFSPRLPPYPTTHARSRTLTRDIIRAPESRSMPSTPTHDRANSAPLLELQEALTARKLKSPTSNRNRSSVSTRRGVIRKPQSYSLFPIGPPPER